MNTTNREIKFRAYDKEEKEFVYAEPIYGFFPELPTECENNDSHSKKHREDRFGDIQQYTGLHDKNGKEIYEGDKVKCLDNSTHKVEWNNDYACFQLSNRSYIGMLKQDMEETYEIIGNIYETRISNPTLKTK